MRTVETAPHEFAANYVYDGLNAFFACDRKVKDGGGSQKTTINFDGETWQVTLYYQDSGLEHPGPRLPTGTEWRLDEMREFRLAVRVDDEIGQRKANFHLAPRWQGMQTEDGNELDVPPQISEGVNVRATGSNIEFARYPDLLRESLGSLGIARRHTSDVVMSNVQDAERYVRLDRNRSGPVHARDGPLAGLAHVLEHDRTGYRKVVQNDSDDHGNTLPGYYATTTLDPERIREVWPDHQLPKEVKHYYAREAYQMDPSNPLAHPKLGASYQVSLADETLQADAESIERLNRELEEAVLSVLADAGLDVAPNDGGDGGGEERDAVGPYIPDAYFDPVVTDDGPDPTALDLTEIRHDQESIVIRTLADGWTETQEEIADTLVTDGGELAPKHIADEIGKHVDTVRRNLRSWGDLVETSYNSVAFASDHIADLVVEKVRQARESVKESMETLARVENANDRGLGESVTEFIAWCAKHGVNIENRADALEIDLSDTDGWNDRKRRIQQGYRLWKKAGRDAEQFRMARVTFPGGGHARAWRLLANG